MALIGCNRDSDGVVDAGVPDGGAMGRDFLAPDPLPDMAQCPNSTDLAEAPMLPMVFEAPTLVPGHTLLLSAADLDGDGHVDLVESAQGVLQVRWGRGAMQWDVPLVVWTTRLDDPAAALVADFDGDGQLDLLADAGDTRGRDKNRLGAVSFIRGGGKGRAFSAPIELELARAPGALVAGDFNRDGRIDAALGYWAFSTSTAIEILRVDGKGPAIASTASLGKSVSGASLIAADWNRDGKLDLAVDTEGYRVGNQNVGAGVLLLDGRGDGTFDAPRLVDAPPYSPLAAADWDGDGRLDLAIGGGGMVALRLGNGDGTFSEPWRVARNPWMGEMAAADWNSDGKIDLATENDDTLDLRVLLNRGGKTFDPQQPFVTGDLAAAQFARVAAPTPIVVVDLDGDGKLDAGLSGQAGTLVLRGNGDGSFRTGRSIDGADGMEGLVVTDLDGDGRQDLVTTNQRDKVVISPAAARPTIAALPGGNTPRALLLGDFNRDGKPDLVTGERGVYDRQKGVYNDPGLAFLGGRQGGDFLAPVHSAMSAGPFALAAADFDGDGILDVATANLEEGRVSLLRGLGDGRFGPQWDALVTQPTSVATADVDGDGAIDLLAGSLGGGPDSGGLFLLRGDGHGKLGRPVALLREALPVRAFSVADVNDDGRADIVAAILSLPGTVLVLLGTCDGHFLQLPAMALPPALHHPPASSVTIADLDGNGLPELVFTRPGSDHFIRCFERCPSPGVVVFRNRGQARFAAPVALGAGYLPNAVAATDVDGDGRKDLVVLNGAGTFSVIRNLAQ